MFGESIPTVPTIPSVQWHPEREAASPMTYLPAWHSCRRCRASRRRGGSCRDRTISRYFGITTRTLARWREDQHSPRWAFDDRRPHLLVSAWRTLALGSPVHAQRGGDPR